MKEYRVVNKETQQMEEVPAYELEGVENLDEAKEIAISSRTFMDKTLELRFEDKEPEFYETKHGVWVFNTVIRTSPRIYPGGAIVVKSLEEFQDLEVKYDLEDMGLSGNPDCVGARWFRDERRDIDVYCEKEIFQ